MSSLPRTILRRALLVVLVAALAVGNPSQTCTDPSCDRGTIFLQLRASTLFLQSKIRPPPSAAASWDYEYARTDDLPNVSDARASLGEEAPAEQAAPTSPMPLAVALVGQGTGGRWLSLPTEKVMEVLQKDSESSADGEEAPAEQAAPGSAKSPAASLTDKGTEDLGDDLPPEEAMDVVAKAATGTLVDGGTDNSSNASSGVSVSKSNASVPESGAANMSLDDVVQKAEADTLTNQTVAKDGADALDRKEKGEATKEEEEFRKVVEADSTNSSITDELNNSTIQEVIRDRVQEAVEEEVVDKVSKEHRLPSEDELNSTVTEELREIWSDLLYARRHRRGFHQDVSIWRSIVVFDWCLLAVFLASFAGISYLVRDWPSMSPLHGGALLIWLGMAGLYDGVIFARLGGNPSMSWLVGYLLELIFSIENLFVYHIIVKAFRMPRVINLRLIWFVVLFQIVFQFIFYEGLGAWLRSLKFLPYVVGVWLVYLGWQAILEEENEDFDIMQTRAVSGIKFLLGDRLVLEQDDSGSLVTSKDGKLRLCPPGLLLLCLLAADFLLEVDVTVTKIEGLPSRYLCFSSSMVATFALPELFFVARDLFARFFALKYGISFILLFVGAQALLHDFFTLTAVASLAVIVGVMIMSVLISVVFRMGKGNIGTDPLPHSARSHQDER